MKDEKKLTKRQKFRARRRRARLITRIADISSMMEAIDRATKLIFDREQRFRETDERIAQTYEYRTDVIAVRGYNHIVGL